MTTLRMRMATGRLGRVVVARLLPCCEIIEAVTAMVEENGIHSALIIGGAASLRSAVLRNVRRMPEEWPLTDEVRIFSEHKGTLELTNMSGNISRLEDGTPRVTVSTGKPDSAAFGGHLVPETRVLSTGEIAIAEVLEMELRRIMDEETKVPELVPTAKGGG